MGLSEYQKSRAEHIQKGRPLKEKKSYSIPKKSAKREAKEKEAKAVGQKKPASKLELDIWFTNIQKEHFGEFFGYCMECGAKIYVQYSRHATAHLLPKKLFKSVATHPLNYLILGAGCGCHEKTHRIDKFSGMRVWPEAARRIRLMIPELPFDELKYISSQLLAALDNTP